MNNSNQTLKFSRTSREAYGYQVHFIDTQARDTTILVGVVLAFLFVLGFVLGTSYAGGM